MQTQFYLSTQEQGKSKEFLKAFNTRTVGEEQYVSAYIHIHPGTDLSPIEALGVNIGIRLPEILTAQIPVSKLKAVAELECVKYVQIGTKAQPQLDKARELTLVDKLQAGEGLTQSFMGKDVVVGIIDGGFEYGHPAFYNADKSEFRIKRVWDQNNSGTKPEGFSYGCEFKTEDEILKATIDERNSHGSHVAGIAAGADRLNDNPYYGIAGDADIVLVSLINLADMSADLVQISDGIKYIYDYAKSVGKPCVINLSLGTHDGPHDGTSSFDVICDQLQGKGRLIVGAVGNDGNKEYHVGKTFDSAESAPLKSGISLATSMGIIDIWGEKGMKYTVQACILDNNGNVIQITDPMDASDPQGGIKTTNANISSGINGYFQVGTEISPLNNKPHASIITTCTLKPNRYIGFIVTPLTAGSVHAWCVNNSATFSDLKMKEWSAPSADATLSEIGGTGKRIITVGAYVSKNKYTTINGEEKDKGTIQFDLAPFSSQGPTADGRMKPTVTAPGSYIASSIPGTQFVNSTDVVKETTWNNQVYRYSMLSGTSMASPMVPGIIATWLEAFPEMTPELAIEAIKNSAMSDEYTGTIENGSNKWGYGKIDAYNGIKEILKLKAGVTAEKISVPEVIILAASGANNLRLLFTEANSNVRIAVYTPNGEMICHQQENLINTAQEINLNVPAEKGIYIVKITGNNYSGNYKAVIK